MAHDGARGGEMGPLHPGVLITVLRNSIAFILL